MKNNKTTANKEHSNKQETVLVTGASGFIELHTVIELLGRGYHVKAGIRNLEKSKRITKVVDQHIKGAYTLSFAKLDLLKDDNWKAAVAECDYVIHMASPFPSSVPKNENDLIVPAREGNLRVLRAVKNSKVKRTVVTSSLAAVLYGHARDGKQVYDEKNWSILNNKVGAYEKSKTIAERAAWDFVDKNPEIELVSINPGLVLGPVLESDYGTSGELIKKLTNGEMPGVADVGWAVVHVQDVAKAHVDALTAKDVVGQRFPCAIEHVSMGDVAAILRKEYGSKGYKIPKRKIPGFILRFAGLFDKTIGLVVGELGLRQDISNDHISKKLNFKPKSMETMVIEMAESMIYHKVI